MSSGLQLGSLQGAFIFMSVLAVTISHHRTGFGFTERGKRGRVWSSAQLPDLAVRTWCLCHLCKSDSVTAYCELKGWKTLF